MRKGFVWVNPKGYSVLIAIDDIYKIQPTSDGKAFQIYLKTEPDKPIYMEEDLETFLTSISPYAEVVA